MRITVNQDYELRDWAKNFGVMPQQLKEAVQAVGTKADDVKKRLKVGVRGTAGSERPSAAGAQGAGGGRVADSLSLQFVGANSQRGDTDSIQASALALDSSH